MRPHPDQSRSSRGKVSAIWAEDADRLAFFFASSLVSFDLEPPLRYTGADHKRRRWAEDFAAYRSIGYEVLELP